MKLWIGVEAMPEIDQVFEKNENFVFRQIDDETILVPIKDSLGDMGSIYNLNEVGAFIWEHFDGQKTIGDIKNRIINKFEISEKEAHQDLNEFVNQLKGIDAIIPKK
jgi:methyltransferase-like protein